MSRRQQPRARSKQLKRQIRWSGETRQTKYRGTASRQFFIKIRVKGETRSHVLGAVPRWELRLSCLRPRNHGMAKPPQCQAKTPGLSGLCKPAVLAIRLGQKSPVPVQGGAKGRLGGSAQRRGIHGSFWQSWRDFSYRDEGLWDSSSPGTESALACVAPNWPARGIHKESETPGKLRISLRNPHLLAHVDNFLPVPFSSPCCWKSLEIGRPERTEWNCIAVASSNVRSCLISTIHQLSSRSHSLHALDAKHPQALPSQTTPPIKLTRNQLFESFVIQWAFSTVYACGACTR